MVLLVDFFNQEETEIPKNITTQPDNTFLFPRFLSRLRDRSDISLRLIGFIVCFSS